MKKGLFILFIVALWSCSTTKPSEAFNSAHLGPNPDYSLDQNWAALPDRLDFADRTPKGFTDKQNQADVDVFFIYPTTYVGKKHQNKWNASVDDLKLNKTTDESSILFQASIFNASGKIYAPRYRQAHYQAFISEDKNSASQALDLAYQDVKNAFQYYLEHYNHNRPIVLAGHSQGALHLIRLLKEFFDDGLLKNKLVVAYVVGYPVPKDAFKHLQVCQDEHQTSCICSWRSYKRGYEPKWLGQEKPMMITNPLNWKTTEDLVPKDKNLGLVVDMKKTAIPSVSAQIYKNILWTSKPKFKGSFLYRTSNFHRGDFNLFYVNVRNNIDTRVSSFWK